MLGRHSVQPLDFLLCGYGLPVAAKEALAVAIHINHDNEIIQVSSHRRLIRAAKPSPKKRLVFDKLS